MSPEPFVSRAKAQPAKRSEKGDGDKNVCDGCLGEIIQNGGHSIGIMKDGG